MKIPGFNLWNWPTQRELEEINAFKGRLAERKRKLQKDAFNLDFDCIAYEAMTKRLKEREFLYYLHSGRFPE